MSRKPTGRAASPPPTPPRAPTTSPPATAARPAADDPDRPVTLAVVTGAHGIRGEVRLKLFTADLAPYPRMTGGHRVLTVKSLNPGANGTIARFAEIADRTAAEALRGTALTVPRSALPPLAEGEYYHVDLIGLPVRTATGEPIGKVVLIEDFGAGDVIEIRRPDGKTAMLPLRQPIATVEGDHIVADPDYLA